jgi:hypothetical protein
MGPTKQEAGAEPAERRQSRRYPVDLEAEYRLLDALGTWQSGRTRVRNLSTGGVWFETPQPLPRGLRVELAIRWPSPSGLIQLVVFAQTVRSEEDGCGARILRHDFRLQKAG